MPGSAASAGRNRAPLGSPLRERIAYPCQRMTGGPLPDSQAASGPGASSCAAQIGTRREEAKGCRA